MPYGTPSVSDGRAWSTTTKVTVESGLCFDYGTERVVECPDGVEAGEIYDSTRTDASN